MHTHTTGYDLLIYDLVFKLRRTVRADEDLLFALGSVARDGAAGLGQMNWHNRFMA